jgi:MFS transporter, DHA2 family, metal-tetracycline-proton antiporter
LPKEHIGIGMGTFTLTSFLSGSVSGAIAMRVLDYTGTQIQVNPLASELAANYSNVFLGMAGVAVLNLWIVYRTFRGTHTTKAKAVIST